MATSNRYTGQNAQRMYNSGSAADASSIDYVDGTGPAGTEQLSPFYYYKRALVDLVKEQYFMPLADVRAMPKHMGKKIKQYHYLPLLDDRNINDQGIDASGTITANEQTATITPPSGRPEIIVGHGANAAAATADLVAKANAWLKANGVTTTGTSVTTVTSDTTALLKGTIEVSKVVEGAGNLYGSSKDIGTITGKLPALSEQGGRVNRVGYSRKTIEGTIHKMGFFDEYTQESLDFDSDSDLEMHVTRESLRGANQITEAALQIDLLNGASIFWPQSATKLSDMAGNNATYDNNHILTYEGLKKGEIYLNDMRCPKDTTIITGSRMIDTRTIGATRILYIGSELQTIIEKMKDYHDQPAFVPKHQYAQAGTLVNGELGAIAGYRVVVVPEMLRDEGKGAAVTANAFNFRETGGKFDVAYALVVGSGSFTSIGFQTDGKAVKFKIYHKKPGEGAVSRDDPYGETGLHSIKWWYGTMILRPEWLIKHASLCL